jgi:hypothetical protein
MTKVCILISCKHCQGAAYVPVPAALRTTWLLRRGWTLFGGLLFLASFGRRFFCFAAHHLLDLQRIGALLLDRNQRQGKDSNAFHGLV